MTKKQAERHLRIIEAELENLALELETKKPQFKVWEAEGEVRKAVRNLFNMGGWNE